MKVFFECISYVDGILLWPLALFSVNNPQHGIMLASESILTDVRNSVNKFGSEHVQLLDMIRSSAEFVSSLLEGRAYFI